MKKNHRGKAVKKNQKASARKGFPLIPLLVGLVALGVVMAAGGFAFAATQEARDAFCASCHTQPESTFFARSTTQAVDLASYHQPQQARCIDCHSGEGIKGRVAAEMMGAQNAFKWFTKTAVQPAVLKYPIQDQNCLKCHSEVTSPRFAAKEPISIPGMPRFEGGEEEGGAGHWHVLLSRWQAVSATAGTCVSCHPGHATDGTARAGFMTPNTLAPVCDACHQAAEGGE